MRGIERRAAAAFAERFGSEPELIASAPGRINLIGEHTDYNDGFVLPCAIERRVAVAVASGPGELYSADFGEARPAGESRDGSWADYPNGVMWAMAEAGYGIASIRAAVAGDVPRGAGLSSSAALESAVALALDAVFDLGIGRRDLAVLCRRAENAFVGVNSGIMDQYASLLCRAGSCLFVDCRSLDAHEVPLDLERAGLSLLVCNTGVERSLAATGYNDRRAACERAASALGVESLRDATMEDLDRLGGEELRRARHVVTENRRVLSAVDALAGSDFERFGKLMTASHRSLRDDYEVSTRELDAFVEVALEEGALGARLTGAGFGGCGIAFIPARQAEALTARVVHTFERQAFAPPVFYTFRPSSGAEIVAGAHR